MTVKQIGMMGTTVKSFRRGPYVIVHEDVRFQQDKKPMLMKSAYSLQGDYIGDTRTAHRLWKKFGIEKFEKISPTSCVCTIGYSPRRKKWFGWSHRAIFGFKRKQKAIRFARSVS